MPEPRLSSASRWTLRAAAVVIVALVAWTYWSALSGGRWPPGHPWSGFTLLSGAAAQLLTSFKRGPSRRLEVAGYVAAAFSLAGAVLWLWSSQLARAASAG